MGARYGLELHPDKLQLLQVQCSQGVRRNDGNEVVAGASMSYLGSSLSADGRVGSELSRRIGAAKNDFRNLQKVWKHSSLSRHRKLEIYSALIESKLLNSLSTACFTKAELRRLDGFQARCLRSVLHIGSSFLTRISNEEDRRRAKAVPASQRLCQQQLILLGKVMRAQNDSLGRSLLYQAPCNQKLPTTSDVSGAQRKNGSQLFCKKHMLLLEPAHCRRGPAIRNSGRRL